MSSSTFGSLATDRSRQILRLPEKVLVLRVHEQASWSPLTRRLCDWRRFFGGSGYAKAFIIGRTYQTGIERKVPSDQTQGSGMSKAAAHILQRGSEIQQLFKQLEAVKEPFYARSPRKYREGTRLFSEGSVRDHRRPTGTSVVRFQVHALSQLGLSDIR
jgi:hypothetical protein